MEPDQEQEIDVAECTFTVWEDGAEIWKGEDYQHAFFLRNMDRGRRKVTVNAKVDITLETMSNIALEMHEPKEHDE
jgi:hypothetical protein